MRHAAAGIAFVAAARFLGGHRFLSGTKGPSTLDCVGLTNERAIRSVPKPVVRVGVAGDQNFL